MNVADDSINAIPRTPGAGRSTRGVRFNLPTLGAGDEIQFQGAWSQNAIWYSGLPGRHVGRGSTRRTASTATAKRCRSPTRSRTAMARGRRRRPGRSRRARSSTSARVLDRSEVGYGELNWSRLNAGQLCPNRTSWMGGAVSTGIRSSISTSSSSCSTRAPTSRVRLAIPRRRRRSMPWSREHERPRRPFRNHPRLLIASGSDLISGPGAKAPGFFLFSFPSPRPAGRGHSPSKDGRSHERPMGEGRGGWPRRWESPVRGLRLHETNRARLTSSANGSRAPALAPLARAGPQRVQVRAPGADRTLFRGFRLSRGQTRRRGGRCDAFDGRRNPRR